MCNSIYSFSYIDFSSPPMALGESVQKRGGRGRISTRAWEVEHSIGKMFLVKLRNEASHKHGDYVSKRSW